MIHVANTIIHFDVFNEEFVCDLERCKGACCVEGDWGAPLEKDEVQEIKDNLESIKKHMTGAAIKELKSRGFYEKDPDGDLVTNCIDGRDCVFAVRDKQGIYKCAIENAWEAGESSFRKPISCHLYPIRINKLKDLEALNYNRWHICSPACSLGQKLKVPVYKFLKEPLIRMYGKEWYAELEEIAAAIEEEKKKF